MASKRQQTMAKIARERAVRERRERKQEKRREKRLAAAEGHDAATEAAGDPIAGEEPTAASLPEGAVPVTDPPGVQGRSEE